MAWPFALPYAAGAASEGLGALGAALAALGIIENKDAIKDAVTGTVTDIKKRVKNRIGNAAAAASPRRVPAGAYENPRVQPSDATRVTTLPRYVRISSYLADEAPTTTERSNNVPTDSIPNPQPAPQPTPTTGSSQTAGGNTTSQGPNNENNNQNNQNNQDKKPKRTFFGERAGETLSKYKPFSGYGEGPVIKDVGRLLFRDAPIVEGGIDALMNFGGYSAANDTTTEYVPSFPLLKYGNPYGWMYSIGEKVHTRPVIRPVPRNTVSTSTPGDSLPTEKQVVTTPVITQQPDSSAIYKFSDL